MELFLGVDGGQSSTVALIADASGRVLGWGRGGPCNHVAAAEGRERFKLAIEECLRTAGREAGLDAAQTVYRAACLGFSGGVADKDAYSREFIRSEAFKITHDAEIALTGATAGAPGIIVIAGTGSIAFGKNSSGTAKRAGGWGYVFGDEGGAFHLVRQALRAALAMEEGWGEVTHLRQLLLERTGSESANDLLHEWYNQFDRRRIAQLAPLIDAAAEAGDLPARRILNEAAGHLSSLVESVHQSLFDAGAAVPVCYIGGVFKSQFVTQGLKDRVRTLLTSDAVPPELPPAAGALLEALRMSGIHVGLSNLPVVKN